MPCHATTQLLAALRHQLGTARRVDSRTATAPRVHTRASPARARVDAECAALRRAVLGAQLVLRAHVLRDVPRLDAHHRDGERRERHEPRKDLRVDRALGGRAQETPAWFRPPVSHPGVLVTMFLGSPRLPSSTGHTIIAAYLYRIYHYLSVPIYLRPSVVCHFVFNISWYLTVIYPCLQRAMCLTLEPASGIVRNIDGSTYCKMRVGDHIGDHPLVLARVHPESSPFKV